MSCRQARQELIEECHRRFWVLLRRTKDKQLEETGKSMTFPPELSSKHDMRRVRSLKVTIKGPFPQLLGNANFSSYLHIHTRHLPQTIESLLHLETKALNLYFTGTEHPPTHTEVKKTLALIYDRRQRSNPYSRTGTDDRPHQVTISWNHVGQMEPPATALSGTKYEYQGEAKRGSKARFAENASAANKSIFWPPIKEASSKDTTAGYVTPTHGSNRASSPASMRESMQMYAGPNRGERRISMAQQQEIARRTKSTQMAQEPRGL